MNPVVSYKLGLKWPMLILGIAALALYALLFVLGGYFLIGLFSLAPLAHILNILIVRIDFFPDHFVVKRVFYKRKFDYTLLQKAELDFAQGRSAWMIRLTHADHAYVIDYDSKYFTADLLTFLSFKKVKVNLKTKGKWIYEKEARYFVNDLYPRNKVELERRERIDLLCKIINPGLES